MSAKEINLNITPLQMSILDNIATNGPGTTYELAYNMKRNYWKLQDACRTLWWKGFVTSVVDIKIGRRKWQLMTHRPSKMEDSLSRPSHSQDVYDTTDF